MLQVNTSFNIDLEFETSPFHIRLCAWVIDLSLLLLYAYLMSKAIDRTVDMRYAEEFGMTELLLTSPFIMYHVLFELLMNGQSPGKMIMKIKVVSLNGQSATMSQYLLRWLLRFVDFGMIWGLFFLFNASFFIGILLMAGSIISFVLFVATPYNQRIGDIVAGTTIILKKLPYQLSDTIFQELDINAYKVSFPEVMRLSDKDINIIDHIVKQHLKSTIDKYVETVAGKIKTVLKIQSDLPDDLFLETLLKDYNYLSRQ